ncbi:gamma-glutamylcyclotransferase [Telmatospirillum siberiense]|uniref:Gamma-glutamylcyclotransferase n=1 Tax=Telmatospirillum siberiense TaxID=382514 RepID=A0A2N3PWB4_9PROT|nr:gamma-glutamylcyclotransferase [Telmatospirillum siberiense]PKU24703.1 gamma-glutamylcyclotransferase [Telmatospirillum siberiense]
MSTTRPKSPILYFAYGANMNGGQISSRCRTKPRVVAVAKLPGYGIAFFGHSERWDGGEETALARAEESLWGVVYELSHSAFDHLDAWQGAKLDGSGPYFHSPAEAIGEDGTTYAVLLYRKDILGEARAPSTEYLEHIVSGAEEHGLPAAYVRKLRSITSEKAGYPVPRADDADRILGAALSCAC